MADIFAFPEEESRFFTRIALRKYERPRPGTPVNTTLQSTIRLPLPLNLTDNFGIEVSDAKLDLLGFGWSEALTAGFTKAKRHYDEYKAGRGISDIMKEVGAQAAATTPGVSDTTIGAYGKLESGIIRNPHITTIFNGVSLKSYAFTWKLAPRSQAESRKLEEMLTYIKAYMHPKIIGAGFALEYPYLATVDFVTGDSKTVLPNVKSSFITNLSINSSASGTPSFFKDGRPVTVEIAMGFKEINIQTRDDFMSDSAGSP